MMRLLKCKSTSNRVALILFGTVALTMSGCGQNLDQALNSSTGASQPQGSSGSSTNLWAKVDLVGMTSNSVLGTYQVFKIDTVNNLLTLSVPLEVNPFGSGTASYPIPQISGATVSVGPNSSGTETLNFTIPLQYLVKGLSFDNPQMLPNGSPLPGVPGGELPRLAVDFQSGKFSIYVYGSVKYFCLYVPITGFNPEVNLTFPINNTTNTAILGYASLVAQSGNFTGGVFMSLVFPPELQAVLDNLF